MREFLLCTLLFGLASAEESPKAPWKSATDWRFTGEAKPVQRNAKGQCTPVSYGCGSCCGDGRRGAYYVNADCSTGCDTRCTVGAGCDAPAVTRHLATKPVQP